MSAAAVSDSLSLLQILVLAIVQGITEFLPISSSAHLVLVPALTGWADQGLAIDVALHIGSLLAVMLYFRRDMGALILGSTRAMTGRWTPDGRLAFQLLMATVPVMLAGFFLQDAIAGGLRRPSVIAATTIGFGLLLWAADWKARHNAGDLQRLAWTVALVIGLAQVLALVPGVSRSGITMTAALFAGLSRTESARFSLLLSIPTTAAAGALGLVDLVKSGDAELVGNAVLSGLFAFVAAYVAIAWLMRFLRTSTFMPFVIYRLLLGALLIALIAGGVIAA